MSRVKIMNPSRLSRNAAIAGLLVAGPLARNVPEGPSLAQM
jgi:hypothetical protein